MEYLNKQEYNLSLVQENIEVIIYSLFAFFVPFFMAHPQWLVGVVVNAALVLAALNLKTWKMLPIIILPSVAVFTHGLIFGSLTMFLVYMIPFIWIGNALLVFGVKRFYLNNKNKNLSKNKFVSLGLGTLFKAGFLFIAALILVSSNVLPAMFLTAMGIIQVYTAIAGGLLAFGIHEVKKRLA